MLDIYLVNGYKFQSIALVKPDDTLDIYELIKKACSLDIFLNNQDLEATIYNIAKIGCNDSLEKLENFKEINLNNSKIFIQTKKWRKE